MGTVLVYGVMGIYGCCMLFIFCYSLMQLHLTYLFRKSQKSAKQTYPEPAEWPTVTVQLPIYNERYVVERLLNAVASFDYPKNKFRIQVLDDSTDETVDIIAKKVIELQQQDLQIKHIRRPNRKGYKAGALQFGFTQTSDEFIAIFDADFVPEPDFLKKVIPAFTDPEIGVIQTRWGHLNEQNSLLTKLQAFGLNAHFTIEQCGRNFGKHFINFNGTGGVWRRKCIENAGGWEADTLTEDLDLSYRAQLKNWKFRYLPEVVVPAELPVAMAALKSQQYRWTKGAAETAKKHAGKLWQSPAPQTTKLHAWFHLFNSSVFVFLLLASLLSFPLFFMPIPPVFFKFSAGLLSGFILLLLFYGHSYFHTEPEPTVGKFLPRFLLFLAVSMGLALQNTVAVLESFAGKKTPFVRTPKYNLTNTSGSWQKQGYRITLVSGLTIVEGILAVLFWGVILLAFQRQEFKFIFFHLMLAVGYSLVFFYSVKHSLAR
jgi:cellulose synthase/poly-beta-1,6-N-acetylglucosamine synthase-like glycosyltransferase